jgi:hypothetical protein
MTIENQQFSYPDSVGYWKHARKTGDARYLNKLLI